MSRVVYRCVLALGLALTSASQVRAQAAANSAVAQALFDQGKALMAKGNAPEACPKFEESQRLDPGSGTLVNLALCYEQTGRIASAWTTYRDAAAAARASGNGERERGALARADALAPKVAKLVIEVPADVRVEGLVITRDGAEVGDAQWGVAIPTDEGEHAVAARAPGHQDWQAKVTVAGAGTTATTRVPRLIEAPAVAAVPPVVPVPSPTGEPAKEPARSSGLGTQRIMALVAGGVGVAGLAVGTIFGVKAISKKNEADETCTDTRCTTTAGVEAGNDAHTAGTISTVALIIGAAGLAGGAALWFTAPRGITNDTQVGLGPGSVVLRGSF